ncbi:YlbG family protein [Calidifontibacillus oryziterrae]|uniref:YlbG family protein n=1 Tax=Calidifontibacillus oryziterrae TaxID=1191699 RepID=UPI0002F27FD1|nr:YlbG family protein [Calidifontibacillus oryziterrae]
MVFGKRQGIIVWLHSLKQIKQLRRFGNIHYVSKKLKYVVIYMDMEQVDSTIDKLKSFSFVKKVEPSYKPFLKTQFENSKPDKAKEYDYKIGI